MEKAVPTPPRLSSPSRRPSTRNVARLSLSADSVASDSARTSSQDATTSLGADSSSSSSSSAYNKSSNNTATTRTTQLSSPVSNRLKTSAAVAAVNSVIESPRIDRSVQSRTLFQITLPVTTTTAGTGAVAAAIGATTTGASNLVSLNVTSDVDTSFDQRGWSSPHGEPYRPLGKPELSLKFSPRLADGSSLLQNAHRMKVFETKDERHDRKSVGEVRHAQPATAVSSTTATRNAPTDLFALFPLTFANKKRPLDERQVKLAHRLHTSVSHYSPERVRGLRRTASSSLRIDDADAFDSGSASTPTATDASSVDLLRRAIRECASRLRTVKNGGGLLAHVPTSEHLDLAALQDEYHRERAVFVATASNIDALGHGAIGSPLRAGSTRAVAHRAAYPLPHQHQHHHYHGSDSGDADSYDDADASGAADHTRLMAEHGSVYLPYTTRRRQRSPAKRHPTISEFKTTLREEKLGRPLLSMQTAASSSLGSSAAVAVSGGTSRSPRSSIRTSRIGDSVAMQRSPERGASIAPVGSVPSPRRSSMAPLDLASSVSSYAALVADGGLRLGGAGSKESEAKTPRAAKPKVDKTRPHATTRHSVERLQAAVDAIEDAKAAHSTQLARAVASLDQDRRDCMATKFRHFSVQRDVANDLQQMRAASESHRVAAIDASVTSTNWYSELLKQLLARDAPLHPAELLLVRAVRRLANDGHAVDEAALFRVLLLVHRDDFAVPDVQHAIAFVRQALDVSLEHWEAFFSEHGLPEPLELRERRERRVERKQTHLARLRSVVTLSKAVRHFSRSDGPPQ